MTKSDAISLWKNDRVLFDCGRHGFLEGTIVEISPSRDYFKLAYNVYSDTAEWFEVGRIKERLPYHPVPRKKGWFS